MAAPPPYSPAAASVSRAKTSRDKARADADAMLRTALSGGNPLPVSSASLSRSMAAKTRKKATRDFGSHSLLSGPQGSDASPRATLRNPGITKDLPLRSLSRSSTEIDSIKLRKAQLEHEVSSANEKAPPRNTAGIFSKACSTDLLFMIDTTSSMKPYIEAAKEQVRAIVADIKDEFFNESQVRVAVVSYKDHGDRPNIQFLEFTASTNEVHSFLDTLQARGGADAPEDVLGGMKQALDASWHFQTRCLIHIADAPSHGSDLNDFGAGGDFYNTPGSEPHGLTHRPLVMMLRQLSINYVFLRINQYTDKMTLRFSEIFGSSNSKLVSENAYYRHDESSSSNEISIGSKTLSVQPQFEELQLGTKYSALRHLVVESVTTSVSRTAGRLSLALGRTRNSTKMRIHLDLASIDENRTATVGGSSGGRGGAAKVVLETAPPQWTTPGWLDERMEVKGFLPAAVIHHAATLGDMMAADENIKLSVADFILYARSKPFAQGALRKAFYAHTAASTNHFVIKSFLEDGTGLAEVAEDMRMQALCKAFALEFNGLLKIEPPLDFIVSSCLQVKGKLASRNESECLSLEPFIGSAYVKYNNNGGYVNAELASDPFNQMAQAFSHFTFERSWGHFLIDDLQGVGHLLTDPSVQTRDPERFKLNDTNMNEDGFKFFFATHKCNAYCEKLELRSKGEMFVSGTWDFRPTWPTMEPTTCCSNKLCRSIIRVNKARKSDKFPAHDWCDGCWSQLESSLCSWICIEPGPAHEFEVSRFYHESQGQLTPTRCPDHREKDRAESGAAVVGGGLWARMKSKSSKGDISGKSW